MRDEKNLDDGYVYFIRCGDDGPIKIGYSKYESAENRLTVAQVYNPFLLTLLSVIPGGRKKEKELHSGFSESNVLGEWFLQTPELLDVIMSGKQLNLTTIDFQKIGPAHSDHHNWKGKDSCNESKRARTARRFKIYGQKCERCMKNNAYDRFHKDRNLDNIDPDNILLLCRRCCMELDGRLDNLKLLDRASQIKPPMPCIICRKLSKPLRKGRCHSCNEYYRRHGEDRNVK